MKLKGLNFAVIAAIQEAVADDEFSATFQKVCDRAKACIYANGVYFEFKKACVSLMCLRFKKKSVLKLSNRAVYLHTRFVI
jgi:hypothetical protein